MAEVRVEHPLAAPVALVFSNLGELLREIAAGAGPWAGFALHVDLGDAGLPDVGYIAIPIALTVNPGAEQTRQYELSIRAKRHPEAFPEFDGSAGVDASGPGASIFWIAGEYRVPGKGMGKFVDATLLGGVARRCIENFARDLERACVARIERREAEYVRYQLFGR